MKQYLLSVYSPEGGTPPPEVLDKIIRDVDLLNQELKAKGAWVFAGGLHPSSTATVVRLNEGDVLVTDGPFVEGKEHIGGFWVIKAPDLDAALEWGRKAARACTVPIEVRPFQEEA
ncbi:MAG TPA: YciI family protein [Candidatus Dormibacteraeota bacterium]